MTDSKDAAERPRQGRRRRSVFDEASELAEVMALEGYLFDRTRASWFRRDPISCTWKRDELGEAEARIMRAAAERDKADMGQRARYYAGVLKCSPSLVVSSDAWDRHHAVIGTPDGCFDLIDCIRKDDHDYMVTKQTGVAPEHGLHGSERARLWMDFLLEATAGDEAMIAYLQRWCGYALSGLTTEHAILFIYGPGGNGKSVFVNTLRHCFGQYARTLPMDALMLSGDRHPAELAMLQGVRLAVATETQEGRRWDEAKLKALTGGDAIPARFMRENWFEFRPTHKLCVVGNHAPQLSAVDEAMRRRLQIVPFTVKPSKPDPDLPAKLEQEARAILSWCMDGFVEWVQQGLNPPASVRAATSAYFDVQDSVGAWLQDCCEISEGAFVSCRDAYASWQAWCDEGGMQAKGIRRLGDDLEKRGLKRARTELARGFSGFRLRYGLTVPV